MKPQQQLLCRGRSTGDLKPWITGYYHFDAELNQHFICSEKTLFRHEVDGDTVGQFTGVEDRNWNNVYQGDIAKLYKKNEEGEITKEHVIAVCEWQPKNMQFRSQLPACLPFDVRRDQIEVIGNIHDNPQNL